MATKSYAQRITETKTLIDGLRDLQDSLPSGIKSTTADDLEKLRDQIETINSEQESLKAELKKKTAELDSKIKELETIYNDTKKRIKLDIAQSLWRKFGIEDKK